MRIKTALLSAASAAPIMVMALAGGAQAQDTVTLRYMCTSDVGGCEIWGELLEGFHEANPGIRVEIESVAARAITDTLPLQLEAGNDAPDLANSIDLGGLNPYYLDLSPYIDVADFEQNFGQTLPWLRGSNKEDTGVYGFQLYFTVNGGFVNTTLFEQAGIPLPGPEATWEDWAEASRQVATATGVQFPMAMDRSGHRFASMAISYGAELVDENGQPVIDDGLRLASQQIIDWNKDGTMPYELWGGTGGTVGTNMIDDFKNANIVFYYGGSWYLGQLERDVGDAFDWAVIDQPCGVAACTGMPGGNAVVGLKTTQHPEEVGKVIEYMASDDVLEEFLARTQSLPAKQSLIDKGIDYGAVSESTAAALEKFNEQLPKITEEAYRFQGYRFQRAMMNGIVQRIGQAINGELDLDQALERIKAETDTAIAAAGQ